MSSSRKTVVVGASSSPYRASKEAILKLESKGYEVIAIGKNKGKIGDIDIFTNQPDLLGVHTVSIYLRKAIHHEVKDYIENLNPRRVIFNPGAENWEWKSKLERKGVEVISACTLTMLALDQF